MAYKPWTKAPANFSLLEELRRKKKRVPFVDEPSPYDALDMDAQTLPPEPTQDYTAEATAGAENAFSSLPLRGQIAQAARNTPRRLADIFRGIGQGASAPYRKGEVVTPEEAPTSWLRAGERRPYVMPEGSPALGIGQAIGTGLRQTLSPTPEEAREMAKDPLMGLIGPLPVTGAVRAGGLASKFLPAGSQVDTGAIPFLLQAAKTARPALASEAGMVRLPKGKGSLPGGRVITQEEAAFLNKVTKSKDLFQAGDPLNPTLEARLSEMPKSKPLPGQAPLAQAGKEAKQPGEMTKPAPQLVKQRFGVDEKLEMRSPHTGDVAEVSYRGPGSSGKSVVWTGTSQFEVPNEWLARSREGQLKILRPEFDEAEMEAEYVSNLIKKGEPYPPEVVASQKKMSDLADQITELERPLKEAQAKEKALKDTEYRATAQKNYDDAIAKAPVYQRANGWDIVVGETDYHGKPLWYSLRDPNTKEEIYHGKFSRVKEVAMESKPELAAKAQGGGQIVPPPAAESAAARGGSIDYWNTNLEKNPLRMGDKDTDAGAFLASKIENAGDILREYSKSYKDKAYLNEKLRRIRKDIDSVDWVLNLSQGEKDRLTQTSTLLANMPTGDETENAIKGLLIAITKRDKEGVISYLDEVERFSQAPPSEPVRATGLPQGEAAKPLPLKETPPVATAGTPPAAAPLPGGGATPRPPEATTPPAEGPARGTRETPGLQAAGTPPAVRKPRAKTVKAEVTEPLPAKPNVEIEASIKQVATDTQVDDLYQAAEEALNSQAKAQGLPDATPPPAVASSRGGRKPPTGKGPTTQGGAAANDPVGKVNELVYGIPGENNARAAARQWDGARRTMAKEIEVDWEKGNKLLKGQKVNKDGQMALFQALHGEGSVPQGQESVYAAVKAIMDKEAADMLAFDPSFSKAMMAHPDYFWRGWKEPKASQIGAGRMGATPGFKKPRVDATFTEMVNSGWEPVSWNPFDMAALRRMAGVEYRENAVLVRRLKETGYAVAKDEMPQKGWRVPHVGPAFEGRPFVTKEGTVAYTTPVAVPNAVASQLEGVYGVRANLGGAGPYISKFTNALKLGKVAFSLFQHVDYGFRAGFAGAGQLAAGRVRPFMDYPSLVGRLFNVSLRKAPRDITRAKILSGSPLYVNGPSLRNIAEEGWMMGSDITFIRRGIMDGIEDATKDAPANLLGKAKQRINQIARFTETGLFEGVARETQAWTLENVIVPNLRKVHPDWTAKQIAGAAADEVNVMYSTLGVWQSTFKDPSTRELLRTLLFSVNESEAWLKMLSRGVKGENQRLWGEFGLGTMIFLAATANAINYTSTGKPLGIDQYSPIELDSPYAFLPGGVGYNTRFMAPKLPWKGKDDADLYLDLVGQADTAYRWVLDPPGAISSRYNVLPRAALNQWKGEAFGGRKLETPRERASQLVSDLFTPIGPGQGLEAVRQAAPKTAPFLPPGETRVGGTGSLIQATGLNVRSQNQREFEQALAEKKGLLKPGERLEDKPASFKNQVGLLPEARSYAAALGNTEANVTRKAKEEDFDRRKSRDLQLGTWNGRGWQSNQGMTPEDWRTQYYSDMAERAGAKKMRDKLNGKYKGKPNPEEGSNDWAMNKYMQEREEAEARILRGRDRESTYLSTEQLAEIADAAETWLEKHATPAQEQYILDTLGAQETETGAQFRKDKRKLRAYWDYQDQVEKDPRLAKYQAREKEVAAYRASGDLRRAEAYDKTLAPYKDYMRKMMIAWRQKHPEEDALLVKWGYRQKPVAPENLRTYYAQPAGVR